ncbi:hypothetical protein BU52_16105 [Streptomyces toyocaensis]|uniref:Right handed beta helix domain-containing protein n=1 Tax=Streptomyces toyocaensis TaxID=55952 RepID=A0A081XRS9_STRTO|nr:hypothetical protein [Streptomyces toyocaensis]KES06252.1 hypothetical protein BU52_16105 [Streptomyces toyocaensis]
MPSFSARALRTIVASAVLTTLSGVTADAAESHTRMVPCHDNAALISAVNEANAAGSGVIRLARKCTYILSRAFPGDYGDNALPAITGNITIEGNGATLARANTAPDMRILQVSGHGALTVENTTLTNGKLDPNFSFGGNAFVFVPTASLKLVHSRLTHGFARWGGGVLNDGPLEIDHSQITRNSTSYGGGGIWNRWTLLVKASEITANTGAVEIGGIATGGSTPGPTATATVRSSRVSDNRGSGIATDVHMTTDVIDSVVTGNTGTAAVPGGGVDNEGTTTLTRSQVVGNHSPSTGGGIYNVGTLRLVRTSVSRNTAGTDGGGIYNAIPGTVTLRHSAVYGNRPNNCAPPGTCPR